MKYLTIHRVRSGFTLVELLVVVSIIGMLASVILVALGSARTKSRNGRIQQETNSLKETIEIGWNGSYYNDLVGTNSAGVARDDAFGTAVVTLANDILAQNQMTIATGYANGISPGGCTYNGVSRKYPISAGNVGINGLTIFTDINNSSGVCANATKYAIYASYGPVVGSSGYFCVDSLHHTTSTSTGGIPVSPTIVATCQ